MTSYEAFCHPEAVYHGTDFWMLNGKLTDGEMIRQLDEMYAVGVRCVIARTYIGLQSDYPGPAFKGHVHRACEYARELGMQIFLQAGYMPEHVLDLPTEYSLDYVRVWREGDAVPKADEPLAVRDGLVYTLYHSGTFLDLFNEDAVAYYLRESYEKMWAGFEEFFGTTVPSIWVDEPSYSGEYLPLPVGFLAKFKARWGYELLPQIHKLFVDDEGFRTVRYHYRKLLEERLEACYFAMLRAWCNAHGLLASGHLMGEDVMETQIDRACAAMPYYRYLDIPGMDILKGHMNFKHNPLHAQTDAWHAHINCEYRPLVTTTPLQLTSVARQTGAEHILCEMYAVTTQNMTFRHQKHMFDYMALFGVNHRSVHGIFYSLHGRSKRTYPPQVNYYQPYFKDLSLLYGYVASTSRFVSTGVPDGDVLVLHPMGSAYAEYVNRNTEPITGAQPSRERMRRRDAAFHDLITSLMLGGVTVDLGDERTIEVLGAVEGDRFCVGRMSYRTVVLPDLLTVGSATLALLRKFSDAGGKIIVLGGVPTMVDGFERENVLDGIRYVTAADRTEVALLTGNDAFSFHSDFFDKALYIRRRTEDGRGYYFLFNPDCAEPVTGVLHIRGRVRAELWDGFTKERTPLDLRHTEEHTHLRLTVPEGGSLMLVTEPTEEKRCGALASDAATVSIPLSNDWQITGRSERNVLLLEFCDYKKGDGAYTDTDYPVLAVQQILTGEDYHGPLTQRFVFHSAEELSDVSLALEDAEAHTITLNGTPVPTRVQGYYLAKDFEVVPLGRLRRGRNILELTREYAPLSKLISGIGSLFQTRTGCELESVYLLGDFAVNVVSEPVRNGDLRFSRRMLLSKERTCVTGELTREGYPFYAGEITLSKTFTLSGDPAAGEAYLTTEALDACLARVRVNGKEVGVIHSAPYRVSLSGALRTGENRLEVTLVNTLRNLLGPYHNPKGEVGNLFGGGYNNPDAAWVGGATDDFSWFTERTPETQTWTDDYLQTPLAFKDPKIQIVLK